MHDKSYTTVKKKAKAVLYTARIDPPSSIGRLDEPPYIITPMSIRPYRGQPISSEPEPEMTQTQPKSLEFQHRLC